MIWIGTSGWVYPHWVGRFYPPDLPAHAQLAYYAQHFPTLEINRSFYRLPTRDQFLSWAEQTAAHPGFLFAVKASRYITHLKKLREDGQYWQAEGYVCRPGVTVAAAPCSRRPGQGKGE